MKRDSLGRWAVVSLAERLREKTDRSGGPEACWLFHGVITAKGYGRISDKQRLLHAHRAAYELERGEIPEGYQIDHLCRNRRCVNPRHLEAVTPQENVLRGLGTSAMNARKTHCRRGHEFTTANTYTFKNQRHCRICQRDVMRRRRAAMKEVAA